MTLAQLLKHPGLRRSDLPNMRNSLYPPRSLGAPSGILEVKGRESRGTTCVDEIILIAAPTAGLFSASPLPTVMCKGREDIHPASPG